MTPSRHSRPRPPREPDDLDVRLYLVTDPALVPAERLVDAVLAAVEGGVTLVQLRDKVADGRALVEAARALLDVLRPLGVPLIVNDRVDVAMAAEADGVHVGQRDLAVSDARRLMGPRAIVGVSLETVEQATTVEGGDPSYVAVSPVYGTPTKTHPAAPLGLAGVSAVCARTERPVVGIGGIDAERAADVIRAGADGVAVVSAILARADVEAAARSIRSAIDAARGERESG